MAKRQGRTGGANTPLQEIQLRLPKYLVVLLDKYAGLLTALDSNHGTWSRADAVAWVLQDVDARYKGDLAVLERRRRRTREPGEENEPIHDGAPDTMEKGKPAPKPPREGKEQ
jgi:23S rRNA G2069 N7-methylase RlmK/C1962 C5-methylase RlmI